MGGLTESDARARYRRACGVVVGVLPRRLRRVVAPSMVGFAAVNGFTFAVDLLLLSLLIDGLGLPLWVGITVAYGTAFALSFVLNRWLTFDPERPVGTQIGRYVAVVAVNYAVVVQGVTHGLAAAGVPYQLARLAAGLCEAVFMYCAMRWFVFGRVRSAHVSSSECRSPRKCSHAAGTYPGHVLSRTDLRGRVPPPPSCARCSRVPRSTSTRCCIGSGRSSTTCASAGSRPRSSTPSSSTRCVRRPSGCPTRT